MESISFKLQNVKCNGCVNNIKTEILKLTGVSALKISLEKSVIEIEFDPEVLTEGNFRDILCKIGYPVLE